MKDYIDKITVAAEALIEAVDDETIMAFEKGEPLSQQPQHTPHYYLALQELRKIVQNYREIQGKRDFTHTKKLRKR